MKALLVVEDEPDIRMILRYHFDKDPDFSIEGEAADVETAVTQAGVAQPDLIVLDHRLEGDVTGLEAAPLLKDAAPRCQIILFSASEELRVQAAQSPHVDAFLLKTEIAALIPLARSLLGLPVR